MVRLKRRDVANGPNVLILQNVLPYVFAYTSRNVAKINSWQTVFGKIVTTCYELSQAQPRELSLVGTKSRA